MEERIIRRENMETERCYAGKISKTIRVNFEDEILTKRRENCNAPMIQDNVL